MLDDDLRHPVDTARETATVAAISGGRFELGLGAEGHMKSEYDAAGLRFDSGATRVDRLIESVEVIRPLLAGDPVDVDGAHYCVRAGAGELTLPQAYPCHCSSAATELGCCHSQAGSPISRGWRGFGQNRDATKVELTHFDAAGLDDRIAVVRDAAGDRFDAIELNALIQFVVLTDDREAAAAELAVTFGGISPQFVLDSPFVLLGTHEQMAETLTRRQQRFRVGSGRCSTDGSAASRPCPTSRKSLRYCASPWRLGARVSLVVDRRQPRHRDVGVELRGGQRRIAEQFLHDAQVRPALQQMRGGAVPQAVRPDIGCAVDRGDGLMDDGAGLPPDRRPPRAPSGGPARVGGGQRGTAVGQPRRKRRLRGSPNGTVRCLLPLPSTRNSLRGVSMSSMSSPHSSLTRIPVAYNNSTISWSRSASGSPCCAPDFAAAIASSA